MIDEKEINLSAIITVIWERGKRIMIFTIICSVLGALSSLTIKNRYEARADLMLNPSKIGERIMEKPAIPIKTYDDLFFHPGVYKDIIDKFELDESPYNLKYPNDLSGRVRINNDDASAMYVFSVQLEDATMACDVTNELAAQAIAIVNHFVDFEQKESTQKIETESNKSLDTVYYFRDIYLKSIKTNLKPLQMQKVANHLTMYSDNIRQKENLDFSIIELANRKKGFEEIFSASNTDFTETITVKRSILTEPLVLETIRDKVGYDANLADLAGMRFTDEHINGSYAALNMEYQKLMVDLPAQIIKRDALALRAEEHLKKITELQTALYDMEVEELFTKGDMDRALEVFAGINKDAGWAGTTVASERQDLVLVHEAVVNPKKVYPRRSLMVGLTGMSAFLLSFLYYLLVDLYGLMTLRTKKEEE
jgi:capsular polysaccharide biosynthesis protein